MTAIVTRDHLNLGWHSKAVLKYYPLTPHMALQRMVARRGRIPQPERQPVALRDIPLPEMTITQEPDPMPAKPDQIIAMQQPNGHTAASLCHALKQAMRWGTDRLIDWQYFSPLEPVSYDPKTNHLVLEGDSDLPPLLRDVAINRLYAITGRQVALEIRAVGQAGQYAKVKERTP